METARWFSLLPAVMVSLKSTSYTNQRYRYAEKLRIQSTYCLEITIFLVYLTPPLTDTDDTLYRYSLRPEDVLGGSQSQIFKGK